MLRYFLKKYKDELARTHTTHPVNCQSEGCPQFQRCPQLASQSRLFNGKTAKLMLLGYSASKEEAEAGIPAIGNPGRYLRDTLISPLLTNLSMTPYVITKMVRANSEDLLEEEVYSACWLHTQRELERFLPEVVLCLGVDPFLRLLAKASNKGELPNPDAVTLNGVRGKFYRMQIGQLSFEASVIYSPGYVVRSPVAGSIFKKDVAGLIAKLSGGKIATLTPKISVNKLNLLRTSKEVFEYFDYLQHDLVSGSRLSFDTETYNLNRKFNNKFLSWQFSTDGTSATIIPIEHPELPLFADPKLKAALVVRAGDFFNAKPKDTGISWIIAHNAKFDLSVLNGLMGIIPKARGCMPWWCSYLAQHWLDENRKGLSSITGKKPYSLKTLAEEFFGFTYKSEHLQQRGDGNLAALSLKELAAYGGADAIITYHLQQDQLQQADRQIDMTRASLERFSKFYFWPASRAIAVMECNGMYTNKDYVSYLQGENSPLLNRMWEIDKEIQVKPEVLKFRTEYCDLLSGVDTSVEYEDDLWGEDEEEVDLPIFEYNKQLPQKLFFLDFLQLNPLCYSKKTGVATLNAEFLTEYAGKYPYPDAGKNTLQLILEHRGLAKLTSTYSSGIETFLIDPTGDCLDSRVRANYNLSGTDTGRLSCLPWNTAITSTDGVSFLNEVWQGLRPPVNSWSTLGASFKNLESFMGVTSLEKMFYSGLKPACVVTLAIEGFEIKTSTEHKIIVKCKTSGEYIKVEARLLNPLTHEVVLKWGTFTAEAISRSDRRIEGLLALKELTEQDCNELQALVIACGYSGFVRKGCDKFSKVKRQVKELRGLGTRAIVSITQIEAVDCFDFAVAPETLPLPLEGDLSSLSKSYVANGILVSNSNNPNFQNIPRGKNAESKAIKNMFQAPPGTILIQGDGGNMEVVTGGNLSRDPSIIKLALEKRVLMDKAKLDPEISDDDFKVLQYKTDYHRNTASLMYDKEVTEVDEEMRQSAKAITFGLMYGKSIGTLCEEQGWSKSEGETKVEKYFSAFPQMRIWLDKQKALARDRGYVETLMGRRRRLAHFYETGNFKHMSEADNKAMNAPIQGQASDYSTIAMFHLLRYIFDNGLESTWLIQNMVHDSILVQVPRADVHLGLAVMRDCFVVKPKQYIESFWQVEWPLEIDYDFELGVTYGGLYGWDGRSKTLPPLLDLIDAQAKTLWGTNYNEKTQKPSKALDLITYVG